MIKLLTFLAGTTALSMTSAAAATLIPLSDDPGGQSAVDSVQQWTQWTFLFDNALDGGNPITDTTGAFQNLKQTFPVFQVGGTSAADGTSDVTRAFTAAAGSPFAIPIFNSICLGNATFGSCIGDDASKDFIDATDRLFLSIDGEVLLDADTADEVDAIESQFRVNTGIFALDLAPNNWAAEIFEFPALQGAFPESYTDGFYAFAELPVGLHSLVFAGASEDSAYSVTALINVRPAPIPVPAALPLFASGLIGLGLVALRRRTRA